MERLPIAPFSTQPVPDTWTTIFSVDPTSPIERWRLFGLVESTGAEGVVLLSGNVHFTEASMIEEGLPYPLTDFTSSALTHVNKTYPEAPSDYRVAGPFVDLNFGLVEIDWEGAGGPMVSLKAIDASGVIQFSHEIMVGELNPRIH